MDGGEGVAVSGAERERNLMKAERWEKVIDLFQSALEREPEGVVGSTTETRPAARQSLHVRIVS